MTKITFDKREYQIIETMRRAGRWLVRFANDHGEIMEAPSLEGKTETASVCDYLLQREHDFTRGYSLRRA